MDIMKYGLKDIYDSLTCINNWLAENDFISLPVANARWQNLAYSAAGNYIAKHLDDVVEGFVDWQEERSLYMSDDMENIHQDYLDGNIGLIDFPPD